MNTIPTTPLHKGDLPEPVWLIPDVGAGRLVTESDPAPAYPRYVKAMRHRAARTLPARCYVTLGRLHPGRVPDVTWRDASVTWHVTPGDGGL